MEDNAIHSIHEGLLPLAQKINSVRSLDQNPNLGDVEAVKRSFKRFGQRKPIVAKMDGEVIAGNTSLAAMKSLEWTHCAVVYVEESEAESKAFALADNRTAEMSKTDNHNLASFINDIREEDPALLEDASYFLEDIEGILNSALDELDYDIDDGTLTPVEDEGPKGEGFSVVVVLETETDREEFLILMRDDGFKAFPKG